MKLREIALQLRGLIGRGVVTASKDGGESQSVNVTAYAGHEPTDVEVLQPFGMASRAPSNSLVVLLAVGGDASDLVALPAGSPGNRMGGLEEGESALYSVDGTRFHAKADGTAHTQASRRVVDEVAASQRDTTEDMIRDRLGDGDDAPRVVLTREFAKMRFGSDWIAITPAGIFSSRPIVVGPDPDPGA